MTDTSEPTFSKLSAGGWTVRNVDFSNWTSLYCRDWDILQHTDQIIQHAIDIKYSQRARVFAKKLSKADLMDRRRHMILKVHEIPRGLLI